MPNFSALLKEEIRRLARREVRALVRPTQRTVAQHRREIAQLKRALKLLEQRLAALGQAAPKPAVAPETNGAALAGSRFSIRSVKAQRRRLKLSAEQYGKLIGVSGQTVYHWEQGKSRPRKAQFARLIAVRHIGRRAARARLKGDSAPAQG